MTKLEDILESSKEVLPISRMEEDYILHIINRQIIPKAIDNHYNLLLKNHPRYTPEQFPRVGYEYLRKNLKKLSRHPEGITYQVDLTSMVHFRFRVIKADHFKPTIYITSEIQFGGIHRAETTEIDIPTNITESVEDPTRITKMEESRGLNYIRKKLIPIAVKSWNSDYIQNMSPGTRQKVTESEVSKNLKKVDHFAYSNYDEIHYQCYIKNSQYPSYNTKIAFSILKDRQNGLIKVGWYHAYTTGEQFKLNNDVQEISDEVETVNENEPPFRDESEQAYIDRMVKISPAEEQLGLHFIRKKLVPKAVDYWNKLGRHGSMWTPMKDHLTNEDLEKRIVKSEERRTPPERQLDKHTHDKITYVAWIDKTPVLGRPSGTKFTFYTTKNASGSLIACYLNPDRDDAGDCYSVHKSLKEIMKEEKDSVEGKFRISKEEEMRALQFIRRMILPTVVKNWNKDFPRHKIKERNINHNLVKKDHHTWPSEFGLYDSVEYISPTYKQNDPMVFKIVKSRDGELKVTFSAHKEAPALSYTVGNWDATAGWFKENTNNSASITKEDEDRGLNFIRKFVIPLFVNSWNRYYKTKPISVKEISHTLIKVGVDRGINYIAKASISGVPLSVKYRIYKDSMGELMASWDFPHLGYHSYFVRDTSIKQDLTEDIDRLSKREELYLLVYLQKTLMPQILEDKYSHFLKKYPGKYPERKYPRITVKDVIKNLKKLRMDVDSASYESIINDDVDFAFHLQKKDGQFMIGAQGPMNIDWSWYPVIGAQNLMESIAAVKYSISKQEEFQALDFIKKKVVPQSVDFKNETNRGYTHEPLVKVSDVLKTLKKVEHVRDRTTPINPTPRDHVVYQVLINDEPYTYSIYKNSEGRLHINKREDGRTMPVK